MDKSAVLDHKGSTSLGIDIPEGTFAKYINKEVLHQVVVMYQASLRQGNASTKERSDVSGGGKKPYKQKGTGRARAGSSRSPLWKGGGVTFGPHPRDFGYSLPKQIRRLGLKESINSKIKDQKFICVEEIGTTYQKTKDFHKDLKSLSVTGKVVLITDAVDVTLLRVTRNIPRLSVMRSEDVNAYSVMKHNYVVVTKKAFENLLDRVKK